MKTMKDYHDLYLKCDVLLLAKDLEIRALWQKHCGNITDVKLELISDRNMYIFFEKCMSGRVSYISHSRPKARIETYYILRRK